MKLTIKEYAYAQACMLNLRQAMQTASAASADWTAVSEEVNDWLDRSGITDIVERASIRDKNLTLKSAFSKATFWQQECIRFASTISALKDFKAFEEMVIGAE